MKPRKSTNKLKFLSSLLLIGGLFASTNANAQPANDDCSGATVLTVGTTCSPTTSTNFDATLSSGPVAECGSDPSADVWFTFIAPAGLSSVNISFTSIDGSGDIVAEVYQSSDNSCDGVLTNVDCNDDGGPGAVPQFNGLPVTSGNTYFIRVWSYDEDVYDDFDICVVEGPELPPCSSLIAPMDEATNVPALPSTPQFVWSAVAEATFYEFWIGETEDDMFSLGEFSDTTLVVNGMEGLTTYYWYIVPGNDEALSAGCESAIRSFTTGEILPPVNDDCINAIALTPGEVVSSSNYGATESMPPTPGCNSGFATTSSDVWYSIVADFDGDIDIEVDESDLDAVTEVFSGTCDELTSIACEDFSTFSFPAIGGETYYIRVDGWNAQQANFSIQLTGDALPVTMNDLKGKVANNNAQLFWNTFSEQNNRGFEIQRSVDGKQFSKVGFVASHAANGNSSQNLAYNFTDATPISGAVYYRLQQVDIDGKTALSNVVRLSATDNSSGLSIVATPNPVANNLKVSILGNRAENGVIQIADITGKVVKSIAVNAADIAVDMVDMAAGVYFVRYNDNLQSQVIKVVKQ